MQIAHPVYCFLQENFEDIHLDWWSKYYASLGEESKCGTYLTDGHKPIKVRQSDGLGYKQFSNVWECYIHNIMCQGGIEHT